MQRAQTRKHRACRLPEIGSLISLCQRKLRNWRLSNNFAEIGSLICDNQGDGQGAVMITVPPGRAATSSNLGGGRASIGTRSDDCGSHSMRRGREKFLSPAPSSTQTSTDAMFSNIVYRYKVVQTVWKGVETPMSPMHMTSLEVSERGGGINTREKQTSVRYPPHLPVSFFML